MRPTGLRFQVIHNCDNEDLRREKSNQRISGGTKVHKPCYLNYPEVDFTEMTLIFPHVKSLYLVMRSILAKGFTTSHQFELMIHVKAIVSQHENDDFLCKEIGV